MASEPHFILDITTVLGASALGGYIANRLRQPVLLGYLASGLLVGPFGFRLLNDVEQIKSLAEIGVAFLLFTLGVEFSLAELKRVKDIALKGSFIQIGFTIAMVAILTTLLGLVSGLIQGIFLGAVLSLSSTAVVLKTLTERGETNTVHGQIMLAILIVQDLSLGVMLAILPALQEPQSLFSSLVAAVLKVTIFLTAALAAGRWLVPPLIRNIVKTESNELFLLTVIALCLGVALVTAHLGLSIEMGAFVAGLTIAELDYSQQVLEKILPLRDTFASLFFASIGMLVEPQVIWENLGLIMGLVALVMLGKSTIIFPIILNFGYSLKVALIASSGLSQIGEFSFVLARVGLQEDFISEETYFLLLGTTAITLVLTPIWLRWSPLLADFLVTVPVLQQYLNQFRTPKDIEVPEMYKDHVVVAGYGRVGQIVVKILRNRGVPVLVVENSEAAIQQLRSQNIPYVFGDADSQLVLEKVHLETAQALAIALPDPASTRLLLKRALEMVPNLDVVVRSHQNNEIDLLSQMGAQEVVQPEFEAALEMGSHLLATLGSSETLIQSVMLDLRTHRYTGVRPERTSQLQPENLNETAPEFHSQWIGIHAGSALNGSSMAAAELRKHTGVTLMGVYQGEETFYYPKGQIQLSTGDRLLVVGEPRELAYFRALARGDVDFQDSEKPTTV
ncbi:cation:proton antiporter [Geitlerinema sp. PCC 9228]|jgi:CPA2 family monovalent cation:H+ antiporter-2|uniref:cation:proton antiporter domain-containing protein n=1 Tax=Geitlerinema sp. PCC 9228 TaxID=111611 RepID=UPI0008F9CC50|nr:cation:proton antiporter [Geitlerinema sp. PCC 9228]